MDYEQGSTPSAPTTRKGKSKQKILKSGDFGIFFMAGPAETVKDFVEHNLPTFSIHCPM